MSLGNFFFFKYRYATLKVLGIRGIFNAISFIECILGRRYFFQPKCLMNLLLFLTLPKYICFT